MKIKIVINLTISFTRITFKINLTYVIFSNLLLRANELIMFKFNISTAVYK